jgi:hypothetical protein
MLVMAVPRLLSHSVMSMPSHAGDAAAEVTWLRRNVNAK